MSSAFDIQKYVADGTNLIATIIASSDSTIDFIDLDDTYAAYVFAGTDIKTSANNTQLRALTSSNNGSTFDEASGNYSYMRLKHESDASYVVSTGTNATHIKIGASIGNDTTESGNFIVTLFSPSETDFTRLIFVETEVEGTGVAGTNTGSGTRKSAAAVNALRFLLNSGDFASGEFRLYGLKV